MGSIQQKVAGGVIPLPVPPDLSVIRPVHDRGAALSKVLVREHLERCLWTLMAEGGAWHAEKNRRVYAAVARALIAALDENGVAWPSETRLQDITGYGESAIRRALWVIAGDDVAPGALFSRRFLRPGEPYTRADGSHVTKGYLYYASRPAEARAADAPPLSVARRNPKAPRNRQRSMFLQAVTPLVPQAPAVRSCPHRPACTDTALCSQLKLDQYRRRGGAAS